MADKQLTTRQQDFLNNLPSCGGDVRLAAEQAGYAEGTHKKEVVIDGDYTEV